MVRIKNADGTTSPICGLPSKGGYLCIFPPDHEQGLHSWLPQDHPDLVDAEQPMPVPNDGESMHDLVIRDILSRDPRWDLSVGSARHLRDQVTDDLDARKRLGFDRYGSLLQVGNGRDFLRDAYEEAMDLAVYLRGCLAERDESSLAYLVLFEVYDDVVSALVRLRRVRNAATE